MGCAMIIPVSVVIPHYKSALTIGRALDSIVKQTAKPAEVIIVDDYSNDGSFSYLRSLVKSFDSLNVEVIALEENGGPGAARNKGWDAAKCTYVAFLDSDDAWHPEKLRIQYDWMENNKKYAMTSHTCKVKTKGSVNEKIAEGRFLPISKTKLLLKNYFLPPSIMIRREIPTRFYSSKKYSEDYLFACEILSNGYLCAWSNTPLAYLYKAPYGEGGLSGNLLRMEIGELEVYRILYRKGQLGLLSLCCYSFLSVFKFFRRCALVAFRNRILF